MKIGEIMTRDVQTVSPDDTIQQAAKLMDDLNVGVVPVVEGGRLTGLVTDRDITVRATSAGKAPDQCRVSEVMTDSPESCSEEDDVQTVVQKMSQLQVRRMPVVRDGQLVGIVALGDLATEGDQPQAAAEALERISEPSEPDRSQTGVQGSGGQDQQGGGLDQLDRSTGGMGGGA